MKGLNMVKLDYIKLPISKYGLIKQTTKKRKDRNADK